MLTALLQLWEWWARKSQAPFQGARRTQKETEEPLGAGAHTHYRTGGGISPYMVDGRPDMAFATKELLRKVSKPVEGDVDKLKKLASYVECIPRCVQWFPFGANFPEDIETYVDSDWSGEQDTRKSMAPREAGQGVSHAATSPSLRSPPFLRLPLALI